jgi:hypothetical protein
VIHVRDAAEGGDTTVLGAGDAGVTAASGRRPTGAVSGSSWRDSDRDDLAAARAFVEDALA